MKKLWDVVNGLDIKSNVKATIFLCICIVVNIGIGAGVWILFGRLFFPEIEWLFCFMGYPAIFVGFFGAIVFLYNHDFLRAT